MTNSVSFKAKARTVDHLGRGQIADCPTAISELWKNSYDAYARNVALHLFDGPIKCAAVFDNGCGMTNQHFIDHWLVIGTESKSTKSQVPEEDRFGLAERKTQGEKGIGRLSAAFLAPVLLVITKKCSSNFTAALIDWRLFENPYLSLSDIQVPVTSFEELDELSNLLPGMLTKIEDNLHSNPNKDDSTAILIRSAWDRFNQNELETATKTNKHEPTTEEKIQSFSSHFKWLPHLVESWKPLLNKVEELDGNPHGTALFLLDVHRELSLLADPGAHAADNHELKSIKKDLTETLKSFVDPFFSPQEPFEYEVARFGKNGQRHHFLAHLDVLSIDEFNSLEHTVVGRFDDHGWFRGEIKRYGGNEVSITLPPKIELTDGLSKVGPFDLSFGTFEQESKMTSHSETAFGHFQSLAENYSGLLIFRDHLRVLPYGRPDNDFFEIEERRSKHAGRYFWSARRLFGRIAISHNENRLLKDKAGREGFISNQATRELKQLVANVLLHTGINYFGTETEIRKEVTLIKNAEYDRKKKEQEKARKTTQSSFYKFLRENKNILELELNNIALFSRNVAEISDDIDPETILQLSQRFDEFEIKLEKFKLPNKPAKLGDKEDEYRQYRDMYNEFNAYLLDLEKRIVVIKSKLNESPPDQVARKQLESNQGKLNSKISSYMKQITGKLETLNDKWVSYASEDRSKYYASTIPTVESMVNGADLITALNILDSLYQQLKDEFASKYEPFINTLNQLESEIDLDSAFNITEEERVKLEEKVRSLHSLAQLGISVEIIGHELEDLDAQTTRGLNMLPSEVKSGPAFKMAFNAHKALTTQIRFLSPLKLSGYQQRSTITGKNIADHICQFFGDRFERQRTDLKFGDLFLKCEIKDLASRIFPVFTNLVNNALYWVTLSNKRSIVIDCVDSKVTVSNSGPPVDEEDIPQLFQLFYSRRVNGRGVGLYLCRENLATAHHKIYYAVDGDPMRIPEGANFIIEFKGIEINA